MQHRPCKNGRTDRAAVWDGEWSELKESCWMNVHIGATWQIQLNDCQICRGG